jgi:hypothetical protein
MSELDAELRQYLEGATAQLAVLRGPHLPPLRYGCYEALILAQGQPWVPARLPRRAPRGMMRHCYLNALNLSSRYPALRYVEGYAVPTINGETYIPVQHAWCVDRFDRVWDNTWPEPQHSAYYGMIFSREEVARFIEIDEETFGILPTEYRIGFPLLRTGRLFPEDDGSSVTSATIA